MNKIDTYLDVLFKDFNSEEAQELKNEFRIHLTESMIQFVSEGLNLEVAMERAIMQFGNEEEIREDLANIFKKDYEEDKLEWKRKEINDLSDIEKVVLWLIGGTGFSRSKEILNNLNYMEREKDYTHQEILMILNNFRLEGILVSEKINISKNYTFRVFSLSDYGEDLYKKLTNEEAVKSKKKKMMETYGSLEFGYMFNDIVDEFSELGYEIDWPQKDLYLPVLNLEKNEENMLVIVDRKLLSDEVMFDKLTEIYKKTREFNFVAPNENILYSHTKRVVFTWIVKRLGGMEAAKGLTIKFASAENIIKQKKNPWDTIKL